MLYELCSIGRYFERGVGWLFILCYRLLMWNNHKTQALPCINTKQTDVKTHHKEQHALTRYEKDKYLMKDNKIIVGALEKFNLPELKIVGLATRIDTGAKTSSLHVDNIVEFKQQNRKWISFDIHPDIHQVDKIVQCSSQVKAKRVIKSSTGHVQTRYIIETLIQLGEHHWPIEISLSDRSNMTYLMLLGREAMIGKLLVDPELNFIH